MGGATQRAAQGTYVLAGVTEPDAGSVSLRGEERDKYLVKDLIGNTGKGALFMAKEFTFEQGFENRQNIIR